MKRIVYLIIFVVLSVTTVFASSTVLKGQAKEDFVLMVKGTSGLPVKYEISKGKYSERIFFNYGKGEYIISSYDIVSDGVFKLSNFYQKTNLSNVKTNTKYLISCKDIQSDNENIKNISSSDILENYKYIAENITYVDDKSITFKDAISTLKEKKGVCLNLSNLFAAMCRSKGVVCKVIVGHTKVGNHAWNKVWYKNKWTNIDITNNFINFSDDLYNAEYEY